MTQKFSMSFENNKSILLPTNLRHFSKRVFQAIVNQVCMGGANEEKAV